MPQAGVGGLLRCLDVLRTSFRQRLLSRAECADAQATASAECLQALLPARGKQAKAEAHRGRG